MNNPFRAVLAFLDKLSAANQVAFLSDAQLLERICEDAEEGRFNTPHSREYDSRRGFRNTQKDVSERPSGERYEAS